MIILHGLNFPFKLNPNVAYKADKDYYFQYTSKNYPNEFSILLSDSVEDNITVYELTKGNIL